MKTRLVIIPSTIKKYPLALWLRIRMALSVISAREGSPLGPASLSSSYCMCWGLNSPGIHRERMIGLYYCIIYDYSNEIACLYAYALASTKIRKGRDNTNKRFVVCYTILFEKKIELSLELNKSEFPCGRFLIWISLPRAKSVRSGSMASNCCLFHAYCGVYLRHFLSLPQI